ncbi:MAG TPA: VWA domain-containing protein [Thermomicrobiales bacterium]|nr:VWA domain-containing protein [Thermomicrobiales bacterium]
MTKKQQTTRPFQISTRWTKPAVAIGDGETHLVVSIATPAIKQATRRPVDVAFVIDRSGSMNGAPLELAKRGVIEALELLNPKDGFAVVAYDDQPRDLASFTLATTEAKVRATRNLREMNSGGSTHLFAGWWSGCQHLLQTTAAFGRIGKRVQRTILLTDGLANVGETDPVRITSRVGAMRRDGIVTSTLGLGAGIDDLLLSGMAEAGGGSFAFTSAAADLPAFFARELGEALMVAVSNVTLTLTLPKGLRARLLNPFPVERHGKVLTIALGDLTAGRTLDLVFEVTARAKASGLIAAPTVDIGWVTEDRQAGTYPTVSADPIMAMAEAEFLAMPFDDEANTRAAGMISAHARQEAMRNFRDGHADLARLNLRMARDRIQHSPAAMHLNAEIDELMQMDQTSPTFELDRRQAMSNAHREGRGRTR